MIRAFALASLLASSLSQAQAPIVGDVEGGEFRPFPLAIAELRLAQGFEGAEGTKGARGVASELVAIVRNDLALSGAFQLLDPRSFIDTDGITQATVNFGDWLNVGAAGLVKAQLREDAGRLVVDLHGFEVAASREGLSKTLTGTREGVRALAHEISDEIFRYFTGEPGPFRTKIAFVKKMSGEKQIFVVDMDGANQRQLTSGGGLNLLPSFTSDGRGLLFTSYRFDNPDLFEVSLSDSSIRRISGRPGLNTGGRTSPDGTTIALTLSVDGNSDIYLLDRAGNLIKRLTSSFGIDTSPTFSPDGKRIAFVSSRAGNPQLYVMDSSGGDAARLTFQGTYNQTPAWSPRGTHIAFTARDERNKFDIFVLDLRTKEIRRVTQDQGNNEEPSFSPNGRLLVFTTTRDGGRQLVVSNLDGTRQTVITRGGEHSSPSWSPFQR